MTASKAYKEFFGVEPTPNCDTVNYSVLAFADYYARQKCKEQRKICAIKAEIEYSFDGEEYIDTGKIEYAPEPEFE